MKQGQMPQALEKADAYIATKPKDAQGRFLKGVILTDLGRTGEAITTFSRLTEDYPELPEPYNNLAVLYAQQKQYDKARAALEMAIRTHPSYAIAHENLGDVYAKMASQAYSKALQIDASNTTTQTKLSLIKDLISDTTKPQGAKPAPAPAQPTTNAPAKPIAPEKGASAVNNLTASATAQPAKPVAQATKASEKTTEPTASQPQSAAEKAVTNGSEEDVAKALQTWAKAWSRKDVKSYLGSYAKNFQPPKGMSRKAWEAERTQRIGKRGTIQVDVDNIKVSISDDTATVRFRQHYNSSSLKSSTSKTIVFVKSGGKWLIQQERIG
ncbi:YybH family protein [Propionivibrio limicola]|uniref:YybH family protein n=1 Tax=Propionivibrio limicola TaxID=167645 RepID=UPI001FEBD005|nr:tetratricopeptide repeat protein [Propionivibrio limicola]